jgi:deoxyhypusine synthase
MQRKPTRIILITAENADGTGRGHEHRGNWYHSRGNDSRGKIHAVCCTGANLEEDLFNLVAHKHYKRVPNYRDLKPEDEAELLRNKLNRVTDTCIPEEEAMRKVEGKLFSFWKKAEDENKRYFPYEFIMQIISSSVLKDQYEIDEKDSWLVAACEKNIPIFVPGWEDSSLGNYFVSSVRRKQLKHYSIVKSGLETMDALIDWYLDASRHSETGFFQIGGGIAGDFSICVVPLIQQDMKMDCRLWSYFCQISDSTTYTARIAAPFLMKKSPGERSAPIQKNSSLKAMPQLLPL